MKYILCGLIRIYQWFSKFKPAVCRFYPTCSHYAYTAISRFGAVRGTYLAIKRLSRCHPWNPGGIDPVPETWEDVAGHRLRKSRDIPEIHFGSKSKI